VNVDIHIKYKNSILEIKCYVNINYMVIKIICEKIKVMFLNMVMFMYLFFYGGGERKIQIFEYFLINNVTH